MHKGKIPSDRPSITHGNIAGKFHWRRGRKGSMAVRKNEKKIEGGKAKKSGKWGSYDSLQ